MKLPTAPGRALLFAIVAWGAALGLTACGGSPDPSPRPRAYPRIIFPERGYQPFSSADCPFTFDYPSAASIERDTLFFDVQPAHSCWFDVFYPQFDGRIHFSYYPIGAGGKDLERLRTDAFELADWHNKRANAIEEILIEKPEADLSGILFVMKGAAASPFQFFLTDSSYHFVRGALYFNTQTRPDSLAPVVSFVQEDIIHLLETFRWK
jgi:gliding motility-associated lipoprotein GldD